MIQMRRELARFKETMVMVQAARDSDDPEATQKAFESYRDTLMPYLKKELRREQARVIEALREEANRGPMKVRPMASLSVARSKLRQQANKIKRGIQW
jgi:hypothetical protein